MKSQLIHSKYNLDGLVGILKRFFLLPLFAVFALDAGAGVESYQDMAGEPTETPADETYRRIRTQLDRGDDTIDYNTLMSVYHSMVRSPDPIPHVDKLLKALIHKRNDDPRVDRMILIFSARAIGETRFPIPDVSAIFESILKMPDSRINSWVISFVAAAIGGYPFDISDSERLVDLLEQRTKLIRSVPKDSQEDFGSHFMPPPKSDFIRSYLAGISKQKEREIERRCYYSLILNKMTETEIEAAVKRLQTEGVPETGERVMLPMRHLLISLGKPL